MCLFAIYIEDQLLFYIQYFFFWSFLIYIVAATGRQWDERRKNDRQTVDVTLWLHQLKIYDQIVFPWATNLLFHFLSFLLFFFDFLQFVLLCRYNVTYSFDSKKMGREKKKTNDILLENGWIDVHGAVAEYYRSIAFTVFYFLSCLKWNEISHFSISTVTKVKTANAGRRQIEIYVFECHLPQMTFSICLSTDKSTV